ncbi:MAG: hypothetical protein K8I30_11230, partial [Anaerolineae bacterium]|nr:hypothetical protein [Anaerolineae bacterium]
MARLHLIFVLMTLTFFAATSSVGAQDGVPAPLADKPLTSGNGVFSLQYPDGWFTDTQDTTIYLANTEANLQKLFDADLKADEIIIRVTVDTPARLIDTFALNIDYQPTPLGLLTSLSEQLEASGYELETAPFVVGDPSLAYLRVSGENNQGQIQVINIGFAYAVVEAVAAPDELAYWQKTIEAVS